MAEGGESGDPVDDRPKRKQLTFEYNVAMFRLSSKYMVHRRANIDELCEKFKNKLRQINKKQVDKITFKDISNIYDATASIQSVNIRREGRPKCAAAIAKQEMTNDVAQFLCMINSMKVYLQNKNTHKQKDAVDKLDDSDGRETSIDDTEEFGKMFDEFVKLTTEEDDSTDDKLDKEMNLAYMKYLMGRLGAHDDDADDDTFTGNIHEVKVLMYELLLELTCYSEPSLHKQLATAKVAAVIASDLKTFRDDYRTALEEGKDYRETLSNLVSTVLGILDNCARTSAARAKLKELVIKQVRFCLDPRENCFDHALTTIYIIERLDPKNTIHKQLFEEEFLEKLANMLATVKFDEFRQLHTVSSPEAPFRDELDTYLLSLNVFARQDDYRCCLMKQLRNFEDIMGSVLEKGTDLEIERMQKLLLLLADHKCGNCSFSFLHFLMLRHGVRVGPSAVERSSSCNEQVLPEPELGPSSKRFSCDYMMQCFNFLQTLKVKDSYFDFEFHRCFCETCFAKRKDAETYNRGKPPRKYALPKGWAKFALKVPPSAIAENVFSEWHIAFHGTNPDVVNEILKTDQLLIPDDWTADGKQLGVVKGHLKKNDFKKIFLSPSVLYCATPHYAKKKSFVDPESGKELQGRVAFQVRVKPGSYDVGKETIGATRRDEVVDKNFPNAELEWSTKCRGVVKFVGILIKVDDK